LLFLFYRVDSFFLLAGLVADGAARLAGGLATGLAFAASDNGRLSFGFCDRADMLHNDLLNSAELRRYFLRKL